MSIFKKLSHGNTLYYPGCLTKFVAKDLAENYRIILRRINIDFIELPEVELCCGSPVLAAGYPDEFQKLAEKNLKIFKDHAVSRIITNCPACFKIFSVDYTKNLGNTWDIKAEYIIQTIARAIKDGELKVSKNLEKRVSTYHDSCHLGRMLGIYDQPREVLEQLGVDLKEMTRTKEYAFCCGGGGGVRANYPELANQVAKERVKLAKEIDAAMLITSCPLCYLHLKENSDEIEVKEMGELIK